MLLRADRGILERVREFMNYTYQNLVDALYLDFDKVPFSDIGTSFCDRILQVILDNENRVRARRKTDHEAFSAALRAVLSALLLRHCQKPWSFSYRSVSKKSFSDSRIKGDTFNNLINELEANGLIQIAKGSNQRLPFTEGYQAGIATRFRATPAMVDAWVRFGESVENIKHHFQSTPSVSQVRLKAGSKRWRNIKANGRSMRFRETSKVQAIKGQLRDINNYLLDQKYTGTNFLGLKRIFNQGDHADFDWNMGGRLYAIGTDNYQSLKKIERQRLTINDEATVELDINASYLRILHGLCKFPLVNGDDVYAVPGLNRSIVKAWISSTLGHTKFHRAWPPGSIKEFTKLGLPKSKIPSYPKLKSDMLKHFPVMETWETGDVNWSRLMYEEAEAMLKTIEALRDLKIPALPVHDSLIVPKKDGFAARQTMQRVFEDKFGVRFVIHGL